MVTQPIKAKTVKQEISGQQSYQTGLIYTVYIEKTDKSHCQLNHGSGLKNMRKGNQENGVKMI